MTKGKTTTDDNNNNSGMGMLLVLFPNNNNNNNNINKLNSPSATKSLISKTQSTISICALLLFITLLLFTLSTLPNTPPSSPFSPPRFLLHNPKPLHKHHFAFQKLGTLYRRGTRPMTDLIICHVSDQTPRIDFRFFLRLLHRSSLTASSDVVFIFSSPSSTLTYSPIILQENDAFTSLIHSNTSSSSFNPSRFFSFKETQIGEREPLWGTKLRTTTDNINFTTTQPLLSYGSVLSFDATELDSENSLSGFLDRVPLSLRRWACYPMLLGRVRHHFKHVMLVDVKSVLILRDPLGRVRNRTADSVLVFSKHGKKTQSSVSSAVVIGGARGVRRLSNAVLVEIVRAAIQHKKKRNSVTDSTVLSQLASNEFMLRNKNVNLILSTESIPEASSLAGHDSGSSSALFSDYALILRGTSNYDLNSVIKKQICSSVVDSSVYSDC